MPKIQKITDPAKIVTDPLVLKRLAEQGIDKDFVEFYQDYAPRSLGKEHSPYAKFYRDLKSNKKVMVVSGLPMVKPDGQKIEVGWLYTDGKYQSKANLFSAIVDGKQVKLTCLSDQPDGAKKDEQVTWRPQLFLDGSEILNGEQPTLLPVDPINENYKENTLEWAYGSICKRRIRVIEGRFREKWLFKSNPHSSVRIKHNFTGSLKLNLGKARDAEGNPLKISVIGDEEIVEATEFDKVVYPVEVGASMTFYTEVPGTVDGLVRETGPANWATLKAGTGSTASDDDPNMTVAGAEGTAVPNSWQRLRRGIFLFNTAGLPDDADISAAVLSLLGHSKDDGPGVSPYINIYSSAPASNTALVPGDFDSLGNTDFATRISYAAFVIEDYNNFTLNATGRAAILRTGISKFGTREDKYDAGTSTPGWVSDEHFFFRVYFAEQGNGYKPKLVVTYTTVVAPTVTTQAADLIEATTARGNGNITNTGGENCDKRGIVYGLTSQGDPGAAAPPGGYDAYEEETDSFGTGAFTRSLTGLIPGRTYYARAYAHNSADYNYGDEVSFTTLAKKHTFRLDPRPRTRVGFHPNLKLG